MSLKQTARRNDPCSCGSGKKYKACCASLGAVTQAAQPADVAAMLAKAHQAVARHDPESTEFWFRQILAVRSHHAEALAGVGQKLCWDGRVREGLELLQRAAVQLAKNAEKTREINGLTQLSDQLHHWGDLETALRLGRLAVRLAPHSAVAHNSLALYLSRVNRVDEALPHARKACQLLPEAPSCSMLLAQLEARQGNLTEAKQRLQLVIAADCSPEHTARSWMELGAVLDRLGDFEQAFDAFSRGTEALSRLPKAEAIDAGHIYRSIDRNKAGFDRALLHRWSREEFADHLPGPVFLLGFLRSGTTLTEQILAAHPEVVTSDENGLIHELTLELGRLSGCGDDVPAGLRKIGLDQARALRRHYWRRVEQEYGPEALQRRFVDKVALNTIDTGLISALFPDARILFALRDPRDVCLSCFMQAFQPFPGDRESADLGGHRRTIRRSDGLVAASARRHRSGVPRIALRRHGERFRDDVPPGVPVPGHRVDTGRSRVP